MPPTSYSSRVALGAQSLDGVGAAEDLPQRRRAPRPRRLRASALVSSESWNSTSSSRAARSRLSIRSGRAARGARGRRAKAAATSCWCDSQAGPGVEDREVLIGIQKLLMLVLSVELDQPVRQVFERGGRGQRARDEGAAPALRGDLASNDDLAGHRASKIASTVARSSPVRTRSVRRAAAEQEADGLDEDRFAGAGFARQDVERSVQTRRSTDSMTARLRMAR